MTARTLAMLATTTHRVCPDRSHRHEWSRSRYDYEKIETTSTHDGKWVIHPSQIEPVNRIFTPSPAELDRARRLLESVGGAARFEGELVDEASRKLAESLLRRAELLA